MQATLAEDLGSTHEIRARGGGPGMGMGPGKGFGNNQRSIDINALLESMTEDALVLTNRPSGGLAATLQLPRN